MKCECGRISNPVTLDIVSDVWLDRYDNMYIEFSCPQCKKTNIIKIKVDSTK